MSGRRRYQPLRRVSLLLLLAFAATTTLVDAFLVLPSPSSSLARASPRQRLRMQDSYLTSLEDSSSSSSSTTASPVAVGGGGGGKEKKKVVVIGAGWGGLSAAYELAKRCVCSV